MARLVSLIVLTALIVALGITFYRVIVPFLLPLFLAGVMTLICQPLYDYFLSRTSNRPRVAAGLTTGAVLTAVLVPLVAGTFLASVQVYTLAQETLDSPAWSRAVAAARGGEGSDPITELTERAVAWVGPYWPGEIDSEKLAGQVKANVKESLTALSQKSLGIAASSTLGFLGSLISFLVGLMMFGIAFYYFLADGPALLKAAEGMIPVNVDYQREMISRFDNVVRAVMLATFVAAISQGVLTALLMNMFGSGHFFILCIVGTLAALIPLAGTWLVWGPWAVWLAVQGHWVQAIVITVVGAGVIGTMDNVIRTYVLNSDAKLHPLLAFISVLGGLQVMGLWGVFIGPIVASCLHALIEIFNTELKEFSAEKMGGLIKREPKRPSAAEMGKAEGDSTEPIAPAEAALDMDFNDNERVEDAARETPAVDAPQEPADAAAKES